MKSCLIVDDSSVVRKVARRILEDIDYVVDEAEDGQEAFDKCRQEMPDAILLDWQMPVMGGLEFLKLLRAYIGGHGAAHRVLRDRERHRPDRAGAEGGRVGLHDEAVRPRHPRGEVPAADGRAGGSRLSFADTGTSFPPM